jgi:hypothetical protein
MERRLTGFSAVAGVLLITSCGGTQSTDEVEPLQAAPLPTAGLAGEPVSVYPVTLMLAEDSLGWEDYVQPRREALDRVDSLIAVLLTERTPEVIWMLPDDLRRAARRAPGMLRNPDQMGTSILRTPYERIPDPLRSQMRTLSGVVGGTYALVPASLIFYAEADGGGRAELTMAIVDVRLGRTQWRTVASGKGSDPWQATWEALKSLVPGLP